MSSPEGDCRTVDLVVCSRRLPEGCHVERNATEASSRAYQLARLVACFPNLLKFWMLRPNGSAGHAVLMVAMLAMWSQFESCERPYPPHDE
jgi:hypothetical protein